jgi:hypothetical protein
MFSSLAQYFEVNWIEVAAMFLLCIIVFDDKTTERIKVPKLKRLFVAIFVMYAVHLIFDIVKLMIA